MGGGGIREEGKPKQEKLRFQHGQNQDVVALLLELRKTLRERETDRERDREEEEEEKKKK